MGVCWFSRQISKKRKSFCRFFFLLFTFLQLSRYCVVYLVGNGVAIYIRMYGYVGGALVKCLVPLLHTVDLLQWLHTAIASFRFISRPRLASLWPYQVVAPPPLSPSPAPTPLRPASAAVWLSECSPSTLYVHIWHTIPYPLLTTHKRSTKRVAWRGTSQGRSK